MLMSPAKKVRKASQIEKTSKTAQVKPIMTVKITASILTTIKSLKAVKIERLIVVKSDFRQKIIYIAQIKNIQNNQTEKL